MYRIIAHNPFNKENEKEGRTIDESCPLGLDFELFSNVLRHFFFLPSQLYQLLLYYGFQHISILFWSVGQLDQQLDVPQHISNCGVPQSSQR